MANSLNSSDSDSQSHYCTVRSLDALRNQCSPRNKNKPRTSYSNTDPPEGFSRQRVSSLQIDDDFTAPSAAAIMEELKAFSPNRLSRARRRQLSLKGLCDDGELNCICILSSTLSEVTKFREFLFKIAAYLMYIFDANIFC